MKPTTLKTLLILGGLMLFGTKTISALSNNSFTYFFKSEISNFNIQGLYVVLGVVGTGLAFYIISNLLNKEERTFNYSKPKHQHRRAIIKKTQ